MKREYVVPDLLASMTADALFAGKPGLRAVQPAPREQPSIFRLGRWFKTPPARTAPTKGSPAPSLTLDDGWVGGWYARTRLLQAATLGHLQERNAASANPSSSDVEGGQGHGRRRHRSQGLLMNAITTFLDWLNAAVVKAERKRREGYLASSANTYELEHRMHMLDRLDTSTMRGL